MWTSDKMQQELMLWIFDLLARGNDAKDWMV
jgi:hypothetical protein